MTVASPSEPSLPPPFDVLSYNVLCDEYVELGYFPRRPLWVIDARRRRAAALAEILRLRPTVACLQEVDEWEQFWRPRMAAAGYAGRYKQRTGGKPDGCAVFVDETAGAAFDGPYEELEFRRHAVEEMRKEHVAQLCTVRPAEGAPTVTLVNTHILYNPRRGDIKVEQVRALASAVARFLPAPAAPLLVCGDLNCTPGSALLSFLCEGRLEYAGRDRRALDALRRPPGED